MLAPKPISPAKELRLKNSIPKLMKALPPIPGDTNSSGPQALESAQDESAALTRYSPVNLAAFATSVSAPTLEPVTMNLEDDTETGDAERLVQPRTSKFKVRRKNSIPGSISTPGSRPWNKDKNYPWTMKTPDMQLPSVRCDSPRPRLKLKGSGSRLEKESMETTRTVKRQGRAERSTVISEISLSRRIIRDEIGFQTRDRGAARCAVKHQTRKQHEREHRDRNGQRPAR